MIDIKRAVLYGVLMLVLYTLWIDWQKDYTPQSQNQATTVYGNNNTVQNIPEQPANVTGVDTPPPAIASTANNATAQTSAPLFSVKTDVLSLGFDTNTGDLVDARLINYKESLENKQPFILLNNSPATQYIASTRLFSSENGALKNMSIQFNPASFHVEQDSQQKQWIVSMDGKSADGLSIKKVFLLKKGEYLIDVHYSITNDSTNAWQGAWSTQFSQNDPHEDKSSLFHLGSYSGGSISIPGEKLYKKISYADMTTENVDIDVKDGWVAMQQHYFLTAWVPPVGSKNKFYTQVVNNTYRIGALSEPVRLEPKQSHEFTSRLYVGPELMDVLKKIAPGLDLTIDYGWLSVISVFLFFILQQIYNFVGNWGWSIIIVTVLIKLAFYRLSQKSYTSMANMRKLQPKLEALKQRFGDDKTKLSQATMELYRAEKVNPLGGCLPIVIQIPVFIGLYWVLLESVQLRQASFIFWIHDLSIPDPYYILPIIMGITMLIQQKLNPPPPDPTQAKIMMFLPVVFTGLFLHFPAGLVLYWVVNNTLSIAQQWYITQKISNAIIKKRFITKKGK